MAYLPDETTTTARAALADAEVALVPTGAVEQHGPALPLGTDYMVAEAIARTVDRPAAVRLPTLPVGVSAHHRQFHGTLWAEPETFEDYLGEVIASVASHGVRKAVVVNGHGGNIGAVTRAARRLRESETAFAAPWNWFDALDGLDEELFDSAIGHADAIETSMVAHVAGDLLREESLGDAEDGAADGWGQTVHGAEVGFDTADFSDSGAVGEPTQGSAQNGEQLFEQAASELDALVDWLVEQRFSDLMPEPHR